MQLKMHFFLIFIFLNKQQLTKEKFFFQFLKTKKQKPMFFVVVSFLYEKKRNYFARKKEIWVLFVFVLFAIFVAG